MPLIAYHWTMLTNIKRDPFEQTFVSTKSGVALGGALTSPSTAYIYDWNLLPIGQKLALDELESYIAYPPLQAPASYNLSQVMDEINQQKREHEMRAKGLGD